jgi:single-strand DNA-binding protein
LKEGIIMLNSVVLAGKFGGDPEIHFNSEGEPVASFDLAFRAGKKKTGWIKVGCFNRLSEICEKHLHQGAKIAVSGLLNHPLSISAIIRWPYFSDHAVAL